jgi:hypothetical protein
MTFFGGVEGGEEIFLIAGGLAKFVSTRGKIMKASVTGGSNCRRLHQRIANIRKEFLHRSSNEISKNHAVVFVEDLPVRKMCKSSIGTKDQPGGGTRLASLCATFACGKCVVAGTHRRYPSLRRGTSRNPRTLARGGRQPIDHQEAGILPASRARYPVIQDNSKSQAAPTPLLQYLSMQSCSQRPATPLSFSATMCKYSFVWYTGDSG